ncbi:MAG: protein kinase, partial [Planctomycetes bacterium]|nr:protein kinase [Planctomycetota bacterium]
MNHANENVPAPSGNRTEAGDDSYFARVRTIKRDLLAEQRAAWEQGDAVPPEDLLARWPTDPKEDSDVASLLFEDYRRRLEQKEEPSLQDYEQRFPEQKNSLAELIGKQDLLRSLGAGSGSDGLLLGLPEVGDRLFDFSLRQELGRGAFARVFLAEQAGLADRPVVLKVSAIEGTEPQTLAQLQHTHVVPIHSVHEDPRAGLRAVCMPYFGGASLSAVLRALWANNQSPRQGGELVAALRAVQAPLPEAVSRKPAAHESGTQREEDPAAGGHALPLSPCQLATLSGLSYVAAAAWVVARVAEGLQHAHQRGVLHHDVKPSNILLSGEGQPMLLDFNLSHDLHDEQVRATLGGTVAYMAPEHLRALARGTPELVRQVDHRSDIYSLGMVLFEMLAGQRPFEHSASYSIVPTVIEAMALERGRAAPSLRRLRGDIPWSLESILRKCLAPDPADRYQQAEELAEDLRRFLDYRPLQFAPELSQAERLRKWMRRHPRLTASGTVALAATLLLALPVAGFVSVRQHLARASSQLAVSQAQDRERQFQAGTVRALCLVNTASDLDDYLPEGLAECRRTLGVYNLLEGDPRQPPLDWQQLDPATQKELAEDARELFLLLAWGQVRAAPRDANTLRQALTLLDRAENLRGLEPSRALWTDRALYLERLGETSAARAARLQAEQIQPVTARDHYLLAAAYARKGDRGSLSLAVAELNAALSLNPRHYWSCVQRGICYQELGEYTLAASDFGTSIGLWPECAWGYFNRGYALDQSGKKAEALASYTAALERDPDFRLAYVNRGLARLELKQAAPALADFDQALARGAKEAFVHAGRGVALEDLNRHPEADQAFATAFARARQEPAAARVRLNCAYAFAVARRLPEKAHQAFDEVLQDEPENPQALYGLAMLA